MRFQAPLVASVVGSCLSVIVSDFTATLGTDTLARPARASVVVALLWSSMLTSLGSTMTAVAGVAMFAGYHDRHAGITKTIVRKIRQWRGLGPKQERISNRAASPVPTVLSAITDAHRDQHAQIAFRAAIVASRVRRPLTLQKIDLTFRHSC